MKFNTPLPQPLQKECAKAAKIFKSFVDSGNNGLDGIIPRSVLENARGFAIFTILKAGFLFTARAGSGVVIAKLADGTWSAPSAIGTAGVGVGGQAGAEMTDFLVVLNSSSAVRSFMSAGSVTLGGNLSVAVGPLGRNGEASGSLNTKGKLAAMYSYSKTRGLFGGVSIEGSVIMERSDANAQAYRTSVTAKQLLSGAIAPPEWASPLIQTLEACTGMPGNRRWVQEFNDTHRPESGVYMFGGVESARSERGSGGGGGSFGSTGGGSSSFDDAYAVGDANVRVNTTPNANLGTNGGGTLKKKGRPTLSFGRRKSSVSYEEQFHDPARAPPPLLDEEELGSGDLTRGWDRPSPRLGRVLNPATGYFETKFETDYVSDAQLKRHPRLSLNSSAAAEAAAAAASSASAASAADKASGRGSGETYQAGSPFNSLPPFDYAQSSLSRGGGSDATSHRRAFSSYTPRGGTSDGADPFASEYEDDEWDLDGPKYRTRVGSVPGAGAGLPKLAPKVELTRPLKPYEGVARAIALYNFDAVQPGDLSFKKGQVITVTEKSQDSNTWWKGKVDGREGMFPANFVEVV